jgi:glycosyltransferase involved in cell wall biosynthesis
MVARVARQKDLETLVRAARQVVDTVSDVHFVVVGDNATGGHREYYQEITALVARLGMANRFVFTGHRSDVQALLSMMDVFVLSTHWEGFPLVILEAMAAGLPVVATAVDGIPEVVVSGETGFLVPHSAPEPLAGSLLRLLREPDLLSRMGSAARAHVSAQFGQEQFRRAVGTLYDRMLPVASVGTAGILRNAT